MGPGDDAALLHPDQGHGAGAVRPVIGGFEINGDKRRLAVHGFPPEFYRDFRPRATIILEGQPMISASACPYSSSDLYHLKKPQMCYILPDSHNGQSFWNDEPSRE